MKIIGTDNLARETVSDSLWLDNIPNDEASKALAQRVCDKLNEGLGNHPGTFYQIKDDGYKLYVFDPTLMPARKAG